MNPKTSATLKVGVIVCVFVMLATWLPASKFCGNPLTEDRPNGAVVGLELGVWDGNNCQRIVHNDRVGIGGAAVVANATAAGSLCAGIMDATGTLPGPETFDIQVTHP